MSSDFTIINKVISVMPLSDFKLSIKYSNENEERIFDFKNSFYWNLGDFKNLHTEKEFNKVYPVFDTVGWDCGLDIAPETLYETSTPLNITRK